MTSISSTSISTSAYIKLVLHSAKYASRSVIGALICSGSPASSSSPCVVVDTIPLFHTPPLAPGIETALSQLSLLIASRSTAGAPLYIGGLYYSHELMEPISVQGATRLPTPQANVVVRIADKISENNGGKHGGARILMLDNVRLGALGNPSSSSVHSALESFESTASSSSSSRSSSSSASSTKNWSSTGAVTIVSSASSSSASSNAEATTFVVEQLRSLIKLDQQRLICDFDDHLDDIKADWTNAEFEKNVMPTM